MSALFHSSVLEIRFFEKIVFRTVVNDCLALKRDTIISKIRCSGIKENGGFSYPPYITKPVRFDSTYIKIISGTFLNNSKFKEKYFGNELRHFFASEKTTAASN